MNKNEQELFKQLTALQTAEQAYVVDGANHTEALFLNRQEQLRLCQQILNLCPDCRDLESDYQDLFLLVDLLNRTLIFQPEEVI